MICFIRPNIIYLLIFFLPSCQKEELKPKPTNKINGFYLLKTNELNTDTKGKVKLKQKSKKKK